MKTRTQNLLALAGLLVAVLIMASGGAIAGQDTQTPAQAGEQVGIEGEFVRFAETAEGYVVLTYRMANEQVNKEWMLLDVGMTLQSGVKSHKITRDNVKLVTPDHKVISMATQKEYEEARSELAALEKRANVMGDSINYFPTGADMPCRIGFFANNSGRKMALAYDEVELSSSRACVGRLFFHVPGGIQYGNYNLDVVFANSIVRVPIGIMTKEQAKEFVKKWKEAEKEAKHKK